MAAKRKMDAKAFAHQKRTRRKWVTFWRMCRYGINNFTRNAWLTIAATAVMTITLLIVFASVASRQILADTVIQLRDSVSMSVFVQTDVSDDDVKIIQQGLINLDTVLQVTYVSPEDAREILVQQNRDDSGTLEAINEATNRLPGTFSVKVADINNIDELRSFVESDETVLANAVQDRPPSFAGERRQAIESIGRAGNFAQQVGIGASTVFVTISMLIIFNTIRMAIFNRREEIQMMKLIGAEKSFIRGPFLVEAIVYGFFAAILASALGYAIIFSAAPALSDYRIVVQPTLDALTFYAGFIVVGMIVMGAVIGIISSLLATQRYLRL